MDVNALKKLYEGWHWGTKPAAVKEYKDPTLDRALLLEAGRRSNPKSKSPPIVECGRLVEVHVREPDKRSDTIIRLTRAEANNTHLVFNPLHHSQRLHILGAPAFNRRMQAKYVPNGKGDFRDLQEVAKITKGRHATRDYLPLKVVPVGVFTHVVYACEKGRFDPTDPEPDGYGFYIHEFGEVSGIRPIIVLDATGRMWVAGGDYTVPDPGITN